MFSFITPPPPSLVLGSANCDHSCPLLVIHAVNKPLVFVTQSCLHSNSYPSIECSNLLSMRPPSTSLGHRQQAQMTGPCEVYSLR